MRWLFTFIAIVEFLFAAMWAEKENVAAAIGVACAAGVFSLLAIMVSLEERRK